MSERAATENLRADHRRIENHLDQLLDALLHLSAARVADLRGAFGEIQRLAGPHFQKEEGVFYPRLRALDPKMLDRMDDQHEHTRLTQKYLGELLGSWPEAPGERDFTELYRLGVEFHDAVQTHIVDEEEDLLRWADRVLSEEEQQTLAAAMVTSASG